MMIKIITGSHLASCIGTSILQGLLPERDTSIGPLLYEVRLVVLDDSLHFDRFLILSGFLLIGEVDGLNIVASSAHETPAVAKSGFRYGLDRLERAHEGIDTAQKGDQQQKLRHARHAPSGVEALHTVARQHQETHTNQPRSIEHQDPDESHQETDSTQQQVSQSGLHLIQVHLHIEFPITVLSSSDLEPTRPQSSTLRQLT